MKKYNKFIYLIIIILIFILFVFYNKKETYSINNTYYEGDIYSLNGSANLLDYFSNNEDNTLLSPFVINTNMAIIFNGTDNNTSKEIRRYFNKDLKNVNKQFNNSLNTFNKVESYSSNEYYEKYIQEFFNNNYNELSIKSLNKLSQKDKESLIALLIKINLITNKINNKTNISYEKISSYKLSDKEKVYTSYEIKDLIDKIIDNYETYNIQNNIDYYSAIYVKKDIFIIDTYQNKINKLYNSNISNTEDITKINNDFKKNTNINHILISDITEEKGIMVSNLSFNYKWDTIFNKDNIIDQEFIDYNNNYYLVEMMYSEENILLENNYATGFIKDFENNNYSFIGILPKDNYKASEINIEDLINSKKEQNIIIAIPRFNITATNNLIEYYQSKNINDLFNKSANLGELTENDLYFTKIIEKETLTIGDKGTKNSSLTSANNIINNESKKEIIFNKPFIFLIINNETKDILFIGQVNHPTV